MDKNLIELSREEYVKEFYELNSNKFSKEQSINIFFGTFFQLVNDKNIFKYNKDIKIFLIDVLQKDYKDYLFNSRAYLTSRALKDLKEETSYSDLISLSFRIAEYLKIGSEETNEGEVKRRKNNDIIDWINLINKNKKE